MIAHIITLAHHMSNVLFLEGTVCFLLVSFFYCSVYFISISLSSSLMDYFFVVLYIYKILYFLAIFVWLDFINSKDSKWFSVKSLNFYPSASAAILPLWYPLFLVSCFLSKDGLCLYFFKMFHQWDNTVHTFLHPTLFI